MPVSALELRPRGAIQLLDAAIRLCARSSGLWALTLPAGALVTGALLSLVDAIDRGRDPLLPSALLTGAWLARGVLQGAACHYLERQVLGPELSVWASLGAALRRLPSLLIAVAYLLFFDALLATATLGLAFFFVGAHAVAYAVTMQGKGHPLALYPTCSTALGPARSSAVLVRILLGVQVLVMVNLHIAALAILYLGQKLFALELTFASRFAALDNWVWLVAIASLGFSLLEPLRAAAATLLLIDGRVRKDGLDLLAAVEQLPTRPRGKTAAAAALILLLLPGAPASAQGEGAEVNARLAALAEHCGYGDAALDAQLSAAEQLPQKERSALSRFVTELEAYAYDDEDCEYVTARLEAGLRLVGETHEAAAARDAAEARERAARILERPEFSPAPIRPEEPEDPEAPSAPPSWWEQLKKRWSDFWAAIGRWLREAMESEGSRRSDVRGASGAGLANVLVIVLVLAVVAVLLWLLLRGWKRGGGLDGAEVTTLEEEAAGGEAMGALSRPPDFWARMADELAARGEYREAVRSLYLALLSRLHHQGAIDYDPAKSNWDYLRAFKGRGEWRSPFRELTRRFDFAYYGNLGADGEGYRSFRSLSEPLLSASPDPEGARA